MQEIGSYTETDLLPPKQPDRMASVEEVMFAAMSDSDVERILMSKDFTPEFLSGLQGRKHSIEKLMRFEN